jgi:hypothetical protein
MKSIAVYQSYYAFLALTLRPLMITAILLGLWIGLRRAQVSKQARLAAWLGVSLLLIAWYGVIWALAAVGSLAPRPEALPPLPIALAIPLIIALAVLPRFDAFASAIKAIPPPWLIGLQVYRLIGGYFIILWALGGSIPAVFALPAGIGDTLVALLALPVAFYVASGAPRSRVAGIAWNVLGIADLTLALTLGFLTSPGPLHILALEQPNLIGSSYPTVLTPFFAVPLSLILHSFSIWQLTRQVPEVRQAETNRNPLRRKP